MKKLLPLFIITTILNISSNSLLSQNCPNSDFSAGNFSNWTGMTGTYNTPATFNIGTPGIVTPAYHSVVTVPGIDPNTAGGLPTIPPGYTSSAMLNSQGNINGAASQLSYSMLVDATNSLFIYNYAVVLQDAGHTTNQQPKFEIMVLDPSNNIIACTYYEVAAGTGMPGFHNNGSIRWKEWEKVGVDLTAYMGQVVTIRARVAGCVQEQGAHFGYAYLTAECMPLEIQVEYCQGDTVATLTAPDGFSSYLWSTGETTQSISIVNPIPGTTNITCTITSVTGCSAILNTIVNPVVATAGFSFTDNCGLVQFTDTSSCTGSGNVINGWDWDFDDAGATSTAQHPSHQYNNPNTYNVTLIATTSAGCSDTVTIPVPVTGLPTASFSTPVGCGLTNTFADSASSGGSSGITTYNWDFGDGTTASGTPVSHTYGSSGTWNIQLVVTNADGCVDTLVQPFTNRNYPTADFIATDVCAYDTADFTDQSVVAGATIVDWDWTMEPGSYIYNTQNPAYKYNGHGVYNVQLIVTTDQSCSDTVVKPVNIWEIPNAAYTVSEVCLGDFSVYTNNSSIGSGAITTYTWDFGDPAFPNNGLQHPMIAYNQDGLYNTQLIVGSDHGCLDTTQVSFNVWPMPEIDFTAGPLEGCYPFTVTFDNLSTINSGTMTYSWDLDDGNGLVNGFEPSIMYPNMENTYSITLYAVSNHGCDTSYTRPNYITVHPKPTASFTYTPTNLDVIHSTIRTENLSVLGDHYFWDFGTGDQSTNFEDWYSYPADTGTYIITLITSTNFGCTDTADAIVHVKPVFTIYIPNSFTPNDDGLNDFFQVYGYNLTDVTMRIFDRWGEELITLTGTDPVVKGWDGRYNQNDAKQDVYVYRIEVTDIFGDYHQFIGQINLLR